MESADDQHSESRWHDQRRGGQVRRADDSASAESRWSPILEELGLLGEIEDREIELPHSDRSKTPIEPYLADQWFVEMDELAQVGDGCGDRANESRSFPSDTARVISIGSAKNVIGRSVVSCGGDIGFRFGPRRICEAGRIGCVGRRKSRPIIGDAQRRSQLPCRYGRGRNARVSLSACGPKTDPKEKAVRDARSACVIRCAGHLVFLGTLAAQHARLARRNAGAGVLLSHQHADHIPRHHHVVGRADGVDGPE